MTTMNKTSRMLGIAFLLQFVTSFSNGLFLQSALIVPGNIDDTLIKIANNPSLMRATILVDMVTAMGIIFLGAMLFASLRKQNEKMALVALGFYILEAALLAASRADAFSLLRLSQEYAAAGPSAYLQTMANLAVESMDFVGSTLHVLVFCPGAILFYYLLYRSGLVPRALSLWGLIALVPLWIITLAAVFDVQISRVVALPYVPFEFVIGVWILIKGTKEPAQ